MAKLTFFGSHERMMEAVQAAPGEAPFVLGWGGRVSEALNSLARGRDVMALAEAAAIGWRAPRGTEIVIDEAMRADPAMRKWVAQAEMRVANPFAADPEQVIRQAESRQHRSGSAAIVRTVNLDDLASRLAGKADPENDGPSA